MSADYPSKREKRPRPSNDVNNSFVKNVTSRMSGLLPSTITKWFGSPSSLNTNGSAPIAESSDSSTEDEAIENPITQPPSKRMRYSTPSLSNDYHVPETKCTGTNTESTETFSVVNSPTSRSKFRPETISTPRHSPNEETISEHEKDTAVYNLQNSYSSIGNQSIVKKRKSLFDQPDDEKTCEKLARSNSVLDLSQPYFKPGLFGSPFYPGKTRYGGAASSYMNQPNIKYRKDTLLSQSEKNDNLNISHATRRVMDLLENYSSPLIEAKRISQFVRFPNSLDNSLNTNAYKSQELHVPSIAKILRLKQKSRLMDTTSAARQIIASNSSSLPFTPYPPSKIESNNSIEKADKLTTKMKTKITRINRDDKTISEIDGSAPIHLPTAVLQIDQNNLPKFTLGTSASLAVSTMITLVTTTTNTNNSTTGTTTATKTINTESISASKLMKRDPVSKNTTEIASKPPTILNEKSYMFSSPVMIHVKTVENSSSLPNYTFGSPDRRTIEESKDKKSLFVASKKPEAQSEAWKCDDCWVSNKSDSEKCVCCGAKKTGKNKSKNKCCSACKVVMSQERFDKCIDCEKKIDNFDNSVTKIIVDSKWKCQDCWVSNEGVDKCVCCGGKKSQEVTPVANANSDDIASEWKCDDCGIKNKSSADKCAACGGAKPTAKHNKPKDCLPQPSIPNLQASQDTTFKNIINLQSDKWECSNCLVRNDKDRSKCLCCDTENPGNVKESEKNSFNFSTKQNTTFKFGIDPNQNISDRKVVSLPVTQLESMVKESETNNNIVTKPATFTFGISKQKSSDSIIAEEKTKAEGTPKQTFKFGLSKPIISSGSNTSNLFSKPIETSPKFSQITQPTKSIETDENVQEVPNIEKPNITTPQNPQKLVGLFGLPLNTSSVATTAPALVSFRHANTQAVPSVTTTAVDAKVPQSTFTFSASSIKPGLQLFSSVTTDSTVPTIQAPSTSSTPMFQKSEPVHTASVNFFSKTDPLPSTITLFNKNETTTTTAAPSSLSTAPVFSFGANTQNIQTKKPKFNFNFGNNSEPNLFNLPTSNTGNGLPSGNTISGNISSGGNGLATEKTVAGTSLSSNSLSSGLLVGQAKKENIIWSSNQLDSIKMSSGNNSVQGINNLPAIQSGNPFSVQAKKDNAWTLNQNTPNDNLTPVQLPTGNNVDPANNALAPGEIFGAPEKKENMWSLSNNNSNLFAPNAGANNLQKPETFSFGSSMQFDSNNVTPTPTFGSLAQPTQNIFGMSSQVNNNQPDMFSSTLQNQTPPNMFGAQAVNNNAPSMGMFGTINTGATPSFGTANSSIPSFEAAPLNPVPAPSFNFGAQQTTGVFGFGQQAQTQGGVYNFGAQGTASPQRQFNIGTAGGAPNAMGRRPIRRAVRRTNQR